MRARHLTVLISSLSGLVVGICSHFLHSSPAICKTPTEQSAPVRWKSGYGYLSRAEIADMLRVDKPEAGLFEDSESPGDVLKSVLTPPAKFPVSAVMEALVARYPDASLKLIEANVTDPDTLHFCLRHAAYYLTRSKLDVVRTFISETDDMWKTRALVSGVIDCSVQDGNVAYAASVLRALPAGALLNDSARQILSAAARKDSEDVSVILNSLPLEIRDSVIERSVSRLLAESGDAPLKAMNLLGAMADASLASSKARDAGFRLAATDLGAAVKMIEKVQSDSVREQACLGLMEAIQSSGDSERLSALLKSSALLRRFVQQ